MAKKTTRKKTGRRAMAKITDESNLPPAMIGDKVQAILNINGRPVGLVAEVAELLENDHVTLRCNHPAVPKLVRDVPPSCPMHWPGSGVGKCGWEPLPAEEQDATSDGEEDDPDNENGEGGSDEDEPGADSRENSTETGPAGDETSDNPQA